MVGVVVVVVTELNLLWCGGTTHTTAGVARSTLTMRRIPEARRRAGAAGGGADQRGPVPIEVVDEHQRMQRFGIHALICFPPHTHPFSPQQSLNTKQTMDALARSLTKKSRSTVRKGWPSRRSSSKSGAPSCSWWCPRQRPLLPYGREARSCSCPYHGPPRRWFIPPLSQRRRRPTRAACRGTGRKTRSKVITALPHWPELLLLPLLLLLMPLLEAAAEEEAPHRSCRYPRCCCCWEEAAALAGGGVVGAMGGSGRLTAGERGRVSISRMALQVLASRLLIVWGWGCMSVEVGVGAVCGVARAER